MMTRCTILLLSVLCLTASAASPFARVAKSAASNEAPQPTTRVSTLSVFPHLMNNGNNEHTCNSADWPHGFPFTCNAGGCPDFAHAGQVSYCSSQWNNLHVTMTGYRCARQRTARLQPVVSRLDLQHLVSLSMICGIVSTGIWPNLRAQLLNLCLLPLNVADVADVLCRPKSYLHCLIAFCDAQTGANAGSPVCWPLLAARAARDAKQITQAKQAYYNVICNSVTDCTPWKIILAADGVNPNPAPFDSQPSAPGLPGPWHPNVTARINPLGVFPQAVNLHYYYVRRRLRKRAC